MIFLIISGLAILLSGCLQTENSNAQDGSYDSTGSAEFIAAKEVFRVNCTTSCHQHAFETQTEAQLIQQGYVVAGSPTSSSIYYRIQGSIGGPSGISKDMPTDKSFSAGDLSIIVAWINSVR